MTQQGGSEGHLLAVLGAAMLIAGLWLPWYSFHIPPEAIQEATQAAGPYAGLVQQGAAILSSLGPIHLTAWNVATAIPAFLLVVGVVGGGLSLLTVIGMADGAGKIVSRRAGPPRTCCTPPTGSGSRSREP